MQTVRRAVLSILIVSFVVLALPVLAQRVIATVPVNSWPMYPAVNSVTNKIYVAIPCGNDPGFCRSGGTVTVIDGVSNTVVGTVAVGSNPYGLALNPVTNKIYVVNHSGNDLTGWTYSGTVTVIDGSTLAITTVPVGGGPYALAVNSVTNKIYVVNQCGDDVTCSAYRGTVTIIDGLTLSTTTVPVGDGPMVPVVNPVTNTIYVPNLCGNDPHCVYYHSPGTVTVIDGATNNTSTVNVGVLPAALDVNTATNKIYVANECAYDPTCQSTAALMTVIDGATLATTEVAVGGYDTPEVAVNSVTNKIYVSSNFCHRGSSCDFEPEATISVVDGETLTYTSLPALFNSNIVVVNSVTNKIYITNCGSDYWCESPDRSLMAIDGATLAFAYINVGDMPDGLALNAATNRVYVAVSPNTVAVVDGTPPTALQFVPLTQPCRAVDTRPERGGGGPIQGGGYQDFPISGAGTCPIMPSAAAYSMNVSVVPEGPLGYLTVWPAAQPRPLVSTLNSLDGRIKANAAIVPAGASGDISVYASHTTNVIVDVNGYFAPVSGSTLAFYALPPCRVADTRDSSYPQGLGAPFLTGGAERAFPILNATTCNIPSNAVAYSLNFSAVPHGSLFYMTVWPTGQTRPVVSTLNDIPGQIIANAAIVMAGAGGEVSVYPTNDTDLVIDTNGYFAAAGTGGLSLYGVTPCRAIDTRFVGLPFTGTLNPPAHVLEAPCGASSLAQAYVFNASVVPQGPLGYLTLWAYGDYQPVVSTLNALDGSISSNMAIVPNHNGWTDAYTTGITYLILDISSYFAP